MSKIYKLEDLKVGMKVRLSNDEGCPDIQGVIIDFNTSVWPVGVRFKRTFVDSFAEGDFSVNDILEVLQ